MIIKNISHFRYIVMLVHDNDTSPFIWSTYYDVFVFF